MSELLTTSELAELCGTDSMAHQVRILNKHGIRYVKGANDKLSVTWTAVNYVLTGQNKKLSGDINWGALEDNAA